MAMSDSAVIQPRRGIAMDEMQKIAVTRIKTFSNRFSQG
jgi:hypothetical protein